MIPSCFGRSALRVVSFVWSSATWSLNDILLTFQRPNPDNFEP
jgi:hypothetical protein